MTIEMWTIIGTGVALGAVILSSARMTRVEMHDMRRESNQRFTSLENRVGLLEQRTSKIEGLLEAWLSGAPRPPLPAEKRARRG